jgi:hypothetical protein
MTATTSAGLAQLMPLVYVVATVVIIAWRVVANQRVKTIATTVLPVRETNAVPARGAPTRLVPSWQQAAELSWFSMREHRHPFRGDGINTQPEPPRLPATYRDHIMRRFRN